MTRFVPFALFLVFALFIALSFSGGARVQGATNANTTTITVSQTVFRTINQTQTVTSTKFTRLSTTTNLTVTATSTAVSYVTSNLTTLEFITLTTTAPTYVTDNYTVLSTTTRTSVSTERLTTTITNSSAAPATTDYSGSKSLFFPDFSVFALAAVLAALVGLGAGYIIRPEIRKRRAPYSYYGSSKSSVGNGADRGKGDGQGRPPVNDSKVSDGPPKAQATNGTIMPGASSPGDSVGKQGQAGASRGAYAPVPKFCQYCGARVPLHQTSCPMFDDF